MTAISIQGPPFHYELLLCPDFAAVLEGRGDAVDESGAVASALTSGRLLVQARGGAGKTVTLHRLQVSGTDAGLRVVHLWAVDWARLAGADGESIGTSSLLASLASVSKPSTSAASLADQVPTLLLLDGLNEVQSSYAREILATVDELASRHPQLGVVVADRLSRRDLSPSWQLATLTPVPEWEIEEVLGSAFDPGTVGLFGNPFFLDRVVPDSMAAGALREFFVAQIGVDDDALRALASAVNRGYRDRKDRLMDADSLRSTVGSGMVDVLVEAQVLESAGDYVRFNHHLLSDFLAALDLADAPERWNRDEFDSLTFTASSFDALGLLLDEVNAADVDLLVRRVHDWNLYAAAHVVAEDDSRARRVSQEMRVALLAMLAERRFDRLLGTANQVGDALRLQRSEFAERLLGAADLSEVMQAVSSVQTSTEWFLDWRTLFIRTEGTVSIGDVNLLRNEDAVLGWTAANVLKRLEFDVEELAAATELLADESATVRWRAAHVLGSVPTGDVALALLERVRGDADLWVRYGAIRSLVEIAAVVDGAQRSAIFKTLGEQAQLIAETPQLAKEIEQSLRLRSAPEGWAEDAGLLLEQLWAQGDTIASQDRWRSVSAALRLAEPLAS